jgi:hypothetical protein
MVYIPLLHQTNVSLTYRSTKCFCMTFIKWTYFISNLSKPWVIFRKMCRRTLPYLHPAKFLTSSKLQDTQLSASKFMQIITSNACKNIFVCIHVSSKSRQIQASKESSSLVELVLLHQIKTLNTSTKTLQHKGPHSIHPLLQRGVNLYKNKITCFRSITM